MDIVKKTSRFLSAAIILMIASLSVSCEKDEDFNITKGEQPPIHNYTGVKEPYTETRRVLILYECGFNDLSFYLSNNIDSLSKSKLPGNGRKEDVVLVFSKLAKGSTYKDTPSYLCRLYTDDAGEVVSDTLKTYPTTTVASSTATMREVLSYIKSTYPAKGYGMIYSSHGSGWLPAGYYTNPSAYERNHRPTSGKKMSNGLLHADIPEGNMETDDPFAGMVRSIGQDRMSTGDVEMSVSEFVEGIPFHLDYLLFDMCFAGGVEVVYPLRNKADYLGVSPAEVLAYGMFDYTTITDYLFHEGESDLRGLFEYSFNRYDRLEGQRRSATVTLLRTDGLDNLAAVCKDLVSTYSSAIARAPLSSIQGYFRANRHYFYDLEDTFAKCGASEEDMGRLRKAIDDCIVYKGSTPSFLEEFDINTYSGLSMYIPCGGTTLLNSMFKDEEWNKAVGLVK